MRARKIDPVAVRGIIRDSFEGGVEGLSNQAKGDGSSIF